MVRKCLDPYDAAIRLSQIGVPVVPDANAEIVQLWTVSNIEKKTKSHADGMTGETTA